MYMCVSVYPSDHPPIHTSACLAVHLIEPLTHWVTHIIWVNHWVAHSLSHSHIELLIESLIASLTHWVTHCVTHTLSDSLSHSHIKLLIELHQPRSPLLNIPSSLPLVCFFQINIHWHYPCLFGLDIALLLSSIW